MMYFATIQGTATFDDTGSTSFFGGMGGPCPVTGIYRISMQIIVRTVSGSPTVLTLKNRSAYATNAYVGTASRELNPAATTLCEWNKGAPILAGDAIRVTGNPVLIYADECLGAAAPATNNFQGYTDVVATSVNLWLAVIRERVT